MRAYRPFKRLLTILSLRHIMCLLCPHLVKKDLTKPDIPHARVREEDLNELRVNFEKMLN